MFCPNCGQQNIDNAAFCVRCGYTLQTANPMQPMRPQQAYPPQDTYMGYPPPAPKKRGKGLLIGLIIGGTVLIAAAVVLVILLLPGGPSVTGVWYNNSVGAVLEFRDNGRVYVYTADDQYKGEYEFDKQKSEGVIFLDDEEAEFELKNDKLVLEDTSFRRADDDFDIDDFIAQADGSVSATISEQPSASAVTVEATPAPTVQTVTEQTITLSFAFGERTGTYTGEVADGLPNGYGTFTSENSEGTIWSYEGSWVSGHFNGQGTSVWEDGFATGGWYENDYLNGEGWESWYGVVQYAGEYLNGDYHGQGTYYNYHGEIIYSGTFYYGIIQESAQDRNARVGAFKDQSVPCTIDELYNACESEISIRAEVSGEIFQVFYYPESNPTLCEIRIYENGIQDAEHVIEIYYLLSEGEALPVEGQSVTVWGTTEYLFTYTTYDGVDLTVPQLEAWSVE